MSPSDSDSDDDILSAKPMFTKVTRKQSASEKRAFNYLDTLLQKGDERIEKKARIQEIQEEEELALSTTASMDDGDHDQDREFSDDHDNIDMNDGGKDTNNGKNNVIKREDSNSITMAMSRHDSITSVTSSSMHGSSRKIDLDNDEYWSKLQVLSMNRSESNKERDRRRQNLRDAIDGVDILRHSHDSEQNNNDETVGVGYDNNICGGGGGGGTTDREQMMASMGIVTGKTRVIGTRKIFGVNHRRSQSASSSDEKVTASSEQSGEFDLFLNRSDCVDELKSILGSLDKALPRSLKIDKSTKKLWNDMRVQIVDPIKKAIHNDLLPQILEKRKSWGPKSQNGNSMIVIPLAVILWLIRTSASGRAVGVDLSVGTYEMIQKLLLDQKAKLTILNHESILKNDGTMKDHLQNHCFYIKNFVSVLESDFGLWTEEGPPPMVQHDEIDDENMKNEYFDNDIGLQHALKVGSLAFQCNLIQWDDELSASCQKESWDLNGDCVCESTARLVAVLCRCGIDPIFHGSNRLTQAQAQILNSIFDWMEDKFDIANDSNRDRYHNWIEHAAALSVKLCNNFVTDEVGDGLDADDKGLFPLALSLRACQMIDQTKENAVRFFATYSRLAAEICMKGIVQDWDSKVESNAKALLEDIHGVSEDDPAISLPIDSRLLAVATSEVTLESIKRTGESVTRNGPIFLAAVDIVAHCEQMGLMLFYFHSKKVNASVGIYESKDEAGAMSDHFQRLESVCNTLKNEVVQIFVDKNMMRVKELLATMYGFYRECGAKAETLSNRGRDSNISSLRQSSMSMFLKECSPLEENSPLNESQDE